MDNWMTLPQAARTVDFGGQYRSPKTLWEWCAHGIRGVRCNHARAGLQYLVREQDLLDFVQRLGEVQTAGAAETQTQQPNSPATAAGRTGAACTGGDITCP